MGISSSSRRSEGNAMQIYPLDGAIYEILLLPCRVVGTHLVWRIIHAIFSVDTSHLSHLSLRDWPRYHQDHSHDWRLRSRWAQPILTSAECLSILKRMEMPQLTSLELVYLAKYAGSDDELLEYVTHTYPRLTHLELHRYRASRLDAVDHVSILKHPHWCRSMP